MTQKFILVISTVLIVFSGCYGRRYQAPEIPQKTVFTVLFGQSNSDPGLEDMLADKIYAEFPDISLEWESVDWGEYFSSEMQAKLASGEMPDMMIGKAQDVAAYQPSGYLGEFDERFYEKIRDAVLESVTVGGKVYGLPYNICYQGVLYNRNIFWRYGIDPPETLSEMDAVIQRLSEVGVTPFATHFRETWFAGNVTMQFAMNQVFLKNPSWGDELRAGRQSFAESEEYAECFRQVKTLFDNTWPDALTVNQIECGKRFSNGEAAMYVTGTWAMQTGVQPYLEVGIFPYPNKDGTARLLFEPNLTFMKNAQSENGELTDAIILSILEDRELAQTVCDFTHTISSLKDVESDGIRKIASDIKDYSDRNRTIDVTIGNRQIVWSFQDACARWIYDWIDGKVEFGDVLRYANDNRMDSAAA